MKSNQLTKRQALINGWTEFFNNMKKEHELLACTVTFRPNDLNNSRERWECEYSSGVLGKLRKAIERNPNNRERSLPFPNFFYFERNESSIFRISGSRRPFHIHGILPIRKSQLDRIWSFENNDLKEKVKKDIYSIGTIESILVEEVRESETDKWISYISKMKII